MNVLRGLVPIGLLALPGCERGCSERAAPVEARAEVSASGPGPSVMRSERCVREAERASVSFPSGTGSIDAIAPVCARGTLALYVVRGHTLSRVERSTAPGSGFTAPMVISTGVDRLGPLAVDGLDGPVAWRSPLAGLDETERDDLWAAALERRDGGITVLRGDALMPAGVVGLGIAAPGERTAAGVAVYASVAREGEGPSTTRVRITLGRDQPGQPTELPAEIHGELKAWEASRRVALARVEVGDEVFLEATWTAGGARARRSLGSRYALVAARGVEVAGRSAFLVGEFALGRGDAGACLRMGEGMCVRPGALYLLLAGAPGGALERLDVAPEGLPDSIASRGSEVTALFVAPEHTPSQAPYASQRASRVDVAHLDVTPLALTPPEGLGAIDGPALVGCDDGVWLAAEVGLDGPDASTRTAVVALPLECLAR